MREVTTEKTILSDNSPILQKFFKDISKYPVYSGEEQIELARKMLSGDNSAREKLIKSNLRFVITCAKKYQGQGVPLLDLIQSGIEGLIQSLDRYDPDRGYMFLSFAVWYIRREILRALYNTGRTIRYPITYISKITKVKKAYDSFLEENGREPSDEELLELTNMTSRQYKTTVINKSYCQSIDAPLSDGEKYTLQDTLAETSNPFSDSFTKETILKVIDKALNEREKKVIKEFYGLDTEEKSIKEIAKELDLGDERVRQIRKGAIKKLNRKFGKTLKTLL